MTSIQGERQPVRRGHALEAPIDRSKNRNHENPLGSIKSDISKALKALTGPSKAPFPILPALDVTQYTQRDINHLQTFF